jgi:hypothetical protein
MLLVWKDDGHVLGGRLYQTNGDLPRPNTTAPVALTANLEHATTS